GWRTDISKDGVARHIDIAVGGQGAVDSQISGVGVGTGVVARSNVKVARKNVRGTLEFDRSATGDGYIARSGYVALHQKRRSHQGIGRVDGDSALHGNRTVIRGHAATFPADGNGACAVGADRDGVSNR